MGEVSSKLERITVVRPAYDCIRVQPCVKGSPKCKPGSGGSHGVCEAKLVMTVSGMQVEVSLVIWTGWYLPSTPTSVGTDEQYPQGAFVEWHTAHPRYEDDLRREPQPNDSCYGWPGCYVNSGFTIADEPTALLVSEGSDAVWKWLEDQHAKTLAELEVMNA